jgi:hypothetical protein
LNQADSHIAIKLACPVQKELVARAKTWETDKSNITNIFHTQVGAWS